MRALGVHLFLGLTVALLPVCAQTEQDKVKSGDALVYGPWIEAKSTANTGPFQWSIDVTKDKQGIPKSVLYIVGNKHKHFVAKVDGNEMKPMDRELYEGWNVPAKAVTACFGWFAGGGDIYYAIRRPHALQIFHRAIDESDRQEQKPELVKSIKL